ncbi:MAG: UDP-N-acetylmuramoyl-L-alanyl-D-glutamate--2,6-diaminopimelate ligase [Acidimicrobiales bacterium]
MRSSTAPSPGTAADIQSPVPLERLLGGIHVLRAQGVLGAPPVTGVTHDSRAVGPGALFCCVPGTRTDGHDHAPSAVAAGAVALLCERTLDLPAAQVVVPDARIAMAPVAAAFHGEPSRRMAVAGVTGTNGKTTVTYLLRSILEAAGVPTAVIGTLTGVHTTPEATELQARLAAVAAAGTRAVAMEVSSEALAQHRADATWFEVVAFTNLSQDHLNFHGTMDDYFAAKASLFEPGRARVAVINEDDTWGRRLAAITELPVRPFSLADASAVHVDRDGSTFTWRGERVRLALSGAFNVSNALAAATIASELDVDPPTIAAGLGAVTSVPGRFQRVDGGGPVAVVVDYAHTPAGLEQALAAARTMAGEGRVLVVFGAGGDRDHAKRPAMGAVATRLADAAVLTSDNPRNEDPMAIIEEVRAGAASEVVVEPDRRAAIALAVGSARPGDVVVIAGKGHETAQVFEGGRSVPFDDAAVARDVLAAEKPTTW